MNTNLHGRILFWTLVSIVILVAVLSPRITLAQVDDCSPIVNALAAGIQVETCSIVEEGSACYASEDLFALLRKSGQPFSAPNDRVEIANLRRLETSAPNGAAIMVVDTPEDPVKIIVFGESSVDALGGNVFTMYEKGGKPICEKTPSGMVVQTPGGDTGQVVVNGVTIRLASTAFISMDGVPLFDQDPRIDRRYGERNPDAPLCSGFDSECDFVNCPVGYRLVWGPFCREDWYDYIEPGLYRVTLHGSGRVEAGATDYNATQMDFAYGVQNLTLPASYTFCYPGLEPGGTGFETLVKARSRNARVDRLTLEYLGRDCSSKTAFRLSADEQEELELLMLNWHEVRIDSLNNLDPSRSSELLTGDALEEHLDSLRQLRNSNCYWIIDEVEPTKMISLESPGPDYAKLYVLKNWDMDLVCNAVRTEMPDRDGYTIGAYTMQKLGNGWFISEKAVYHVGEEQPFTDTPSRGLQLMTITNIEGAVEVTTLGVTRVIPPGQQVQVVLYQYRPLDISEPTVSLSLPASTVIDWLANDDSGLPLVNSGRPGGGPSIGSGSSLSVTDSLAEKIVFVTGRDYEAFQLDEQLRNAPDLGEHSIYVMDSDGSNQVQLFAPIRAPFVSGNLVGDTASTFIAQAAYYEPEQGVTTYDLSTLDSTFFPTSEPVYQVHDVSPDGETLLVTLFRPSPSTLEGRITVLALLNLATGSTIDLFTDPGYSIQFGAWSPDGRRIAFTSRYQLWVINVDGSDRQMMIDDARDVAWSRNGQYIAYEAGSTGDQDICQMPPGSVPAMVGQRVPGIASCTETKNQRFKSIGASWKERCTG